jgi:Animal haem peroxidase
VELSWCWPSSKLFLYLKNKFNYSKKIFCCVIKVNCKFFAAGKNVPGSDLRSLDYQTGREFGEPNYGDVLRKVYGVKKCNNDITKADLVKHTPEVRDMFAKRFKGNFGEVGYTLATDFENKDGQILSPTNSFVIAEQLKRTVCGDRFWFSNGNVFKAGKIELKYNFL